MRRFKFFILLLSLLFLVSPKSGIYDTVKFTFDNLDLLNVKKTKDVYDRSVFRINDVSYRENRVPHITDLILSFNKSASKLLRDDSNNYPIRYASYNRSKDEGAIGSACAKFFTNENRVEIPTDENQWLGSCKDLGSFTIEFRLKPIVFKNNSMLFSRTGFLSGIKNGIDIRFYNNRIIANLFGVFRDSEGRRINVYLNRGKPLREKRWYHFSLTYDRISGRLARYLNGEEEEVVYVSEKEEPFINTYEPSFNCEDKPIAVIGKDYYGLLDEFRITYRNIENLKKETDIALKKYKEITQYDRTPVNREGVITSPIYTLPSTGTMIRLFKWDEILKKDTFIWMEFRISDDLFTKNDAIPRWYRITNNQRNIFMKELNKSEYLRGKYYQWRAHLIGSPDGRHSPAIYDIEMNYQLDPPPSPPSNLEVVKIGDETVRLKWRKNPEADVHGYKIYYGLHSKRYDGKIGFIGGKRITNENGKGNYIEIDITNGIIDENKNLDLRRVLSYPILKNTVLYYFAISAYDNYKPDTVYNHESNPSNEVTARPFAGSEIE